MIVADLAPNGVLISPVGARQGEVAIGEAVCGFWQTVKRVEISVARAFLCGEQGAAEWIWTKTRLNGSVHRAEDAIVFEVNDGKVVYWREYSDTTNF